MRTTQRFAAVCMSLMTMVLVASGTSAQDSIKTLKISSPTLRDGEAVPRVHTPDGRNDSPELKWEGAPAGTRSFAVLCEDPGVGNPPPFVHWIVYNIPASAKRLPSSLPIDGSAMPDEIRGTIQGLSGFRRAIYRGPAPPPGKVHDYHFVVYALDTNVETPLNQPPLSRAQLLEAMQGHILAKGELVATYERK
jgi:Raf kinase inhibitor-like YbhB/YbcL family protein